MSVIDEIRTPVRGPVPRPEPSTSSRQVILDCLAIVSVSAAVIHFAVAGEHYQEYWVFGVFMLVSAFAQSLWALAAFSGRQVWLTWAGVVLNGGIVGVYALTRTVGPLIGPTPHEVESVGFGDGLCTVLESVLALACLWLIVGGPRGRLSHGRSIAAVIAAGVSMAALLSVALVDGGPEMVMSPTASDASTASANSATMPMGGAVTPTTAAIKLATATPAGDITMPDSSMQMGAGMQMVTPNCTATPSVAQQSAAVSLVNSTWQDTTKYQSLAAAKADGYQPITPTGQAVVHYLNPAYYRATALGGPVLNSAQPQSLVYANTPHGAVLVAAMFIMSPLDQSTPPQPGGCLTQWHEHTNLCLNRTGVVATTSNGGCPAGSANRVTQPMLHIWFVPIPGGPTAVDATNAQVLHAAEQVNAPSNPTA